MSERKRGRPTKKFEEDYLQNLLTKIRDNERTTATDLDLSDWHIRKLIDAGIVRFIYEKTDKNRGRPRKFIELTDEGKALIAV